MIDGMAGSLRAVLMKTTLDLAKHRRPRMFECRCGKLLASINRDYSMANARQALSAMCPTPGYSRSLYAF